MVRRFVPRISIFKSIPRVSPPLLPLTSRLGTSSSRIPTTPHIPSSSHLFSHFPTRLTSSPPPNDGRAALPSDATLSQRLKHLIKSYGWYALGVYLVLSAADFAVAFAGINLLGAEQVSRVAMSVKAHISNVIRSNPQEPGRDELDEIGSNTTSQEGLYAMLVLAYTIHKTLFLPVRVGLTAALTPKLVGWLRARGWAGGAGVKRAATEMRERMRSGKSRD